VKSKHEERKLAYCCAEKAKVKSSPAVSRRGAKEAAGNGKEEGDLSIEVYL
jgi:hypothetical protein